MNKRYVTPILWIKEMLRAFEKDENWIVAAVLEKGLPLDAAFYDDELNAALLVEGSTMLHWAAAFGAIDSAKVRSF